LFNLKRLVEDNYAPENKGADKWSDVKAGLTSLIGRLLNFLT
jgi:hypothetical protein